MTLLLKNFTVKIALMMLYCSKGRGPDGITASMLKYCSPILSGILCDLFNKSVSDGIIPEALKSSYVTPFHKLDLHNNIHNYKPIAIQSALSKLFEKFILSKILNQFLSASLSVGSYLTGQPSQICLSFITDAFSYGSPMD